MKSPPIRTELYTSHLPFCTPLHPPPSPPLLLEAPSLTCSSPTSAVVVRVRVPQLSSSSQPYSYYKPQSTRIYPMTSHSHHQRKAKAEVREIQLTLVAGKMKMRVMLDLEFGAMLDLGEWM